MIRQLGHAVYAEVEKAIRELGSTDDVTLMVAKVSLAHTQI